MKTKLLIVVFLFVIINCSAQFNKLLDFNFYNGAQPTGNIISDGTFLYGMASNGGAYNAGVIYKIKPDGTGYLKLLDFAGPNGIAPYGSLFYDGTYLYGLTYRGGDTADNGTIFKIFPDGTGYTKLHNFDLANGALPFGSLVFDGSFLYGTTDQGGVNNKGVVFKIKRDGSGFTKLYDFASAGHLGDLLIEGNYLYGMISYGGVNGMGTIFKLKFDGTGYTEIYDFFGASNGMIPYSSLISDGNYLYGMTVYGGSNGMGTIFKIKADGSNYIKLLDFSGSSDGRLPYGALTFDGTFLFGMTYMGGASDGGVIFKLKPDGSNFLKLHDFVLSLDGAQPQASLVSDGAFLYGTAYNGGISNASAPPGWGTIFKFNPYCDPVNYTQSPTICFGDSVIVAGNSYYSNGVYKDTLTTFNGCDSVIITNITVLPPNEFNQYPTICAGQNISVGGDLHNTTGTYVDLLTSLINGCDSTVTTHLTVLSPSASPTSQTLTICSGESVTVGTDIYSTSGTYVYGFIGGSCDSVVTTNLTVLPLNTSYQSLSICSGQTINIGSSFYYSTGVYKDTLIASNSCDSILTTGLTVFPANTMEQYETICSGESITIGGNTYSSSGTYTDIFPAANLCDSTVTTHLYIIDTSVTIYIGANWHVYLTTNVPSTVLVHWIDCNNGNATIGGVSHTYHVTVNGSYAAVFNYGLCNDTSACYSFTDIGIAENDFKNSIQIWPNPSTGIIQISSKHKVSGVEVRNIVGEQIHQSDDFLINKSANFQIDLSDQPNGIYFVNIKTEQEIVSKKIVINR